MAQWELILLVFARMSAFMAVGPLFSLRPVPPLLKAGTGLILAVLVTPVVKAEGLPADLAAFSLAVLKEAMVGLALGYMASLVFHAISLAGHLVDLQMGLVMTHLLDPETGANMTLLGEFFHLLGLLLLLQMDGHHSILRALADSFTLAPPGAAAWQGGLADQLARAFSGVFALAFRLAAPLVAALVVSDVALALVSRAVPQLNVFMMGFQVKVGVGLIVLVILLPLLAGAFNQVFGLIERDMALVGRYLVGR